MHGWMEGMDGWMRSGCDGVAGLTVQSKVEARKQETRLASDRIVYSGRWAWGRESGAQRSDNSCDSCILTRVLGAHPSKISFSWRTHESQANHIMVRSWSTSSFHAIDWFCSRNSRVSTSHRSMFSGLTKSHATLMQSARLHT